MSQQFSPVADWMSSFELFLEDEGQQQGTWKRRPQLLELRLLVWRCGLATTGKRQVTEKEQRNHFGRNSPNARWPCVAKLSILKHIDLGVLPCDILTALSLRVHSLPLENPTTPGTRLDPAVAQTSHDLIGESSPCFSREIQRAAFAILWMGFVGKEKDSLACLPPLSLKRQESLVAKSGVLCYPAAHGFRRSHIK